MVPSVEIAVDLVGAVRRVRANGRVARRPANASGSAEVRILPSTRSSQCGKTSPLLRFLRRGYAPVKTAWSAFP